MLGGRIRYVDDPLYASRAREDISAFCQVLFTSDLKAFSQGSETSTPKPSPSPAKRKRAQPDRLKVPHTASQTEQAIDELVNDALPALDVEDSLADRVKKRRRGVAPSHTPTNAG